MSKENPYSHVMVRGRLFRVAEGETPEQAHARLQAELDRPQELPLAKPPATALKRSGILSLMVQVASRLRVLLFFLLMPLLGPLWVLGCLIAWPVVAIYQAAAKKLRPCIHGTTGAAADISLCQRCKEAYSEEMIKRDTAAQARETHRRNEEVANQAAKRRALALRKKEVLRKTKTLASLQSLEPYVFQGLIWATYRKAGYEVQETSFTKDGGVDGFLVKGPSRLVLQCKRYKGDVGEPVVRDLFGTTKHHDAAGAILVTTGTISQPARTFAQGKAITLIDGKALLSLLEEADLSEDLLPDQLVAPAGEQTALLKRALTRLTEGKGKKKC